MLNISNLDQDSYHLPNWAAYIDDVDLTELANYVHDAVTVDDESRKDWLETNESWVKLAQQVIHEKNYPWPKAAAVKFPLLTTAALQFHARAHQELLKDERIVMAKVVGKDAEGEKASRGRRVEDAMSLQFLYRMEDWQDDMDRLLYVLPMIGTAFKKVYWSDAMGRPSSDLVLPNDMIVSYYATDWKRARKTHRIWQSHNEIIENQRVGNYLEVDLKPAGDEPEDAEELGLGEDEFTRVTLEGDTPHELYECHCWYDMDYDGYEEPYIVTLEKESRKVLRVVPRYRLSDIRARTDGVIMAIEPLEYVVPYKFFPAIDSNVYGTGFGHLLGPLNKAVNSLINQLIDAGTLSNQQAGFLGRGVRVSKGGSIKFRPGEWKELSSTGDDLRKGVYPLPVREPNSVLFQLLGYLVEAGKEVSSVAEVMTGQNPGQNQPYSTTATVLDQGMQVFLGIYKRIYRSLSREYRLVYNLNYMYLTDAVYGELLDGEAGASVVDDFAPQGLDIVPEADPNMANSVRKQARVQALIEASRSGLQLNQEYIQRQFLEAIDEPEIEEVMKVQPPPPSEAELADKRFYKDLEYKYKDLELKAMINENQPLKDEAAALANVAKATALGQETEGKKQENMGKQIENEGAGRLKEMDAQLKRMDADNALQKHFQELTQMDRKDLSNARESDQKIKHEQLKLEQAKQKANASTNE